MPRRYMTILEKFANYDLTNHTRSLMRCCLINSLLKSKLSNGILYGFIPERERNQRKLQDYLVEARQLELADFATKYQS